MIEEMINELDIIKGSDGLINYSEFLASTINLSQILTIDKAKTIFKMFDVDDTGFITVEDMQIAF